MDEDYSDDISAFLHTGEHIFARSLQNLGLDIHVRKADTTHSPGLVEIREIIPLDAIRKALKMTNDVILQGLPVETIHFDTLKEGKEKFPNLRFNEERLNLNEPARIVKIGDYDVSACKNKHARNTKEVVAFSIVSVSYIGGITSIKFLAGEEGMKFLSDANGIVVEAAYKNNVGVDKVNELIENLKKRASESEGIEKGLAMIILKKLNGVIDLRSIDISVFSRLIGEFKKFQPSSFILLFSEDRVIGIRGEKCVINFKEFGEALMKEDVFVGDIHDDYINGKIKNTGKFLSLVSSLQSFKI